MVLPAVDCSGGDTATGEQRRCMLRQLLTPLDLSTSGSIVPNDGEI